MRRTLALTALLLSVLAGACTAKENKANPDHLNVDAPPAVTDIPQMASVTGKALPLQAFQVGDQARATISLARRLLIADCMKRFGFTYRDTQGTPANSADLLARRYGITDATAAAKWGYGGPPDTTKPAKPPQDKTDPSEALVLTGWPNGQVRPGTTPPPGQKVGGLEVPAGGCAGEAGRKLTGDDTGTLGDDPLVQDIDASGYSKAEADTRVTEMLAKWSSCMREKGYNFPNSLAAVDSITRTGGQAPPTEIQLAVADVECKVKTNYVGVWFTVESAYQNALIEKNSQTLAGIKTRIDKTLSTANSVVAAGR